MQLCRNAKKKGSDLGAILCVPAVSAMPIGLSISVSNQCMCCVHKDNMLVVVNISVRLLPTKLFRSFFLVLNLRDNHRLRYTHELLTKVQECKSVETTI